MPQSIYNLQENLNHIIDSNFPSSFFFAGSISIIFILISRMTPFKKIFKGNKTKTNQKPAEINPLKYFIAGLLPASLLFCAILIYQHYTGFELRSHVKYGLQLSNDNLLQNGTFRVYGFYGHPLTVAAIGLAYAVFSWTLLWIFIAKRSQSRFYFIPFEKHKYIPLIYLCLITIANTISVILSSGRTATMINFLILIGVPAFICFKRKPIFTILVTIFISISSFFIAKKYGVIERIDVTANSILNSRTLEDGNNRQYFWEVYTQMFLDKPIVGQGSVWIAHGVREQYYDKLGYAHITQKFNAHNNYLEIFASVGITGALLIIYFIFMILSILKKELQTQKDSSIFLFTTLIVTLTANIFHATTQNVFFDSSFIYIILSLIYVIIWHIIDKNMVNNKKE
ncbi:O-antigen ligase family protein [Fluviispira multicolorata]|nr:O-antigen ligase family protein [Fluviispira multicolorata]